jgi:Ala-tRNA(Pro) deacylase
MANIYEVLKNLNIKFTEHRHPAVYTCDEAEKYYANVKGGKSKNLLLRDKKGHKFYLVISESSKKTDLKSLAGFLNEGKLSFASEEQLIKYLGLTPGSVSPFGLINDKDKNITVVIDENLWKYDRLHFHPNVNTATLELDRDDFEKFLDYCGNKVIFYK